MKSVVIIRVAQLSKMAENMYGTLVKAVVDLKKQSMVVDAEMHADEKEYLLENGSAQADLWDINLYPERFGTKEFDSMINIRPRQQNMSRGIEDVIIQQQIIELVSEKEIA